MIHDAQVEVTCDGNNCEENTYVDLEFVYMNRAGGGGHYDHSESSIGKKLAADGWIVKGEKQFCSEECAGEK